MINYWWVTRPKRKLDSIPEVLTVFADMSLDQEWKGQRNTQMSFEDALEKSGLKRPGLRRDQSGSGGRTYGAWLESLGLIFHQESTGRIKLTLAGEAIIAGEPPVDILKAQVLKYQFPSSFSMGRNVNVSPRFKIRPFRFLLRLLLDKDIAYLTQEEIAKVVIVEAENESDSCFQHVKDRLLAFRRKGDAVLEDDFLEKYGPGRGTGNPEKPYGHLEDCANTIINWMEYTQLAKRDENRRLVILDEKREEAGDAAYNLPPFIDRPEQHEYFQRKYGLDPKHKKDTRNLEGTSTVTSRKMAEQKVRSAYIRLTTKRPITGITPELITEIAEETGILDSIVEELLQREYPHGSIGGFYASYFEMAFKGRDEAVDFEKATSDLFQSVFGYRAEHLGQTGSRSAPDVLLLSDTEGYQAIVDNKAYSRYSITGDHHNRMVHNYIEKLSSYSPYSCRLAYFTYIAGGLCDQIDRQIQSEAKESGTNGSAITVSTFISMIRNETEGKKHYSHADLERIFGLNRQIRLSDI